MTKEKIIPKKCSGCGKVIRDYNKTSFCSNCQSRKTYLKTKKMSYNVE